MATMTRDQMRKKLIEADNAYYNDSDSSMTDEEYDDLRDEFNSLYPEDSYFESVGAEADESSDWKKTPHIIFMGSLSKIKTVEDFLKFANDTSTNDFILEDKMDGLTVEDVYEKGNLIQAITRGNSDSNLGEDIYENVKKMKNVKLTLTRPDGSLFKGSLKGEIHITNQDFEKINEILLERKTKELKNPRNGASGLAKRYDGNFSEFLSILYYDVLDNEFEFETEEQKLNYIKQLGLPICNAKRCNKEQAIALFKEYEDSLRAKLNYDVDGLVVKINDLSIQEKLGITGAVPKGQKAWKFKAIKMVSKVLDVKWHLGGGGRITPIIYIEPTKIGGVTVKKMTAHNIDKFKNLGLYKGCKLLFQRSNDVIPIPLQVVDE